MDTLTGRSGLPRPFAEAVGLPRPEPDEAGRFVEALDARRMGARLAAALGTGPRPCHVLDAKYEPGVRGLTLYRSGDDLIRGDLLLGQEGTGGASVVVAPGVRLSVFPHEPSLPTLPSVMAAAEIGAVLARVLPGQTRDHARALARRCRVDLLRYRPGRRVTVRVRTAVPGPGYVGKVYHDPTKAAAVAEEAHGLAGAVTPDGTLRYAPTLAHVPELSLVVQGLVRGVPLDAVLMGAGGAPSAVAGVRRAAAALAELHRSPVVSTRERPVSKELIRFRARAEQVATADPLVGRQLAELADRLLASEVELRAGPLGLVHGDCKPGQFLLGDDVVYLLDLDHCGLSDQAGDVGTFLASLRQLAVKQRATARRLPRPVDLVELAAVFRATYLRHVGDEGMRSRILWHEAVALQRKALRAFARAPRSPLPAALVVEGHRCLDQLRGGQQ